MRVLLARMVLFVLVALAAAGSTSVRAEDEQCDAMPAAAPDEAAVVVRMHLDRFDPDVLTIPAGTTVTWTNEEPDRTNAHNVISLAHGIESPLIYPGESWSFTFTTPGTYAYFCDLHEGMLGTIIVE